MRKGLEISSSAFTSVDREYIWTYPTSFGPSPPDMTILAERTRSWAHPSDLYLYVHVPFCRTDCTWCVFYRERFNSDRVQEYVEALLKEIQLYTQLGVLAKRRVTAVYFGGGTASVLTVEQLGRILQALKDLAPFDEEVEVTWEAHPRTVDLTTLKGARQAGVNRVSFGIQSFSADTLKRLRIAQTPETNWQAVEAAHAAGFPKVNMDLIYRVPGQTQEDLEEDLAAILRSGVTGVSCYSLETRDTRYEASGWAATQPNDDDDCEMFYRIGDRLHSGGLLRIAQPDFAREDKDCRYLQAIWGAPQAWGLGLGPGALSSEVAGFSFFNISSLEAYVKAVGDRRLPIAAVTRVTQMEAMARYFVLGLRRIRAAVAPFEALFGVHPVAVFGDQLRRLADLDMVSISSQEIALTRRGLYYVDNISKEFYTDDCRGRGVPWGELERGRVPPHFPKVGLAQAEGGA